MRKSTVLTVLIPLIFVGANSFAAPKCSDLFKSEPLTVEEHAPVFSKAVFDRARSRTKRSFIGLDTVIDSVFNQIESWYLSPETRKVPTVIFMSGMTGTGKTALVRTMMFELGLQREFYYYDMEKYSGKDQGRLGISDAIADSLTIKDTSDELELSRMQQIQNPVLMFDEFQKVNTRDQKTGEAVERPSAQTVFELLGNMGELKVQNPTFANLRRMLENPDLYIPIPSDIKYGPNKDLKDATFSRLLQKVQALFKTEAPQSQLDLSKSLIFISANLDQVYAGSRNSDPEIVSADELNRSTSNIRDSDIRAGLMQIFRPEHVGRFGSRYVSFPTLPEKSFRQYIAKGLREIKKSALQYYGIQLSFSRNFIERIYREGVIPSQGMRPLVQSVNAFALDPLSNVFNSAKKAGYKTSQGLKMKVDLDSTGDFSVWKVTSGPLGGKSLSFLIPNEYLNSLKLRPEPYRSHIAIRLAAKVTLSALTTRGLPTLVKSNSRVTGKDGIISFDHADANAVDETLQKTYIFEDQLFAELSYQMASYVAEKMIFGQTSRASDIDLQRATAMAAEMAGNFGMSKDNTGNFILRSAAVFSKREFYEVDTEFILQRAYAQAEKILQQEREFFAAVSSGLTRQPVLGANEINTLFNETWSEEGLALLNKNLGNPAQDFISNPSLFKFKSKKSEKVFPKIGSQE
jgi:hypothetical protein